MGAITSNNGPSWAPPPGGAPAAGPPAPPSYPNSSLVPPLTDLGNGSVMDATGKIVQQGPNGLLTDPNTGYSFTPDGQHIASPTVHQQGITQQAYQTDLMGALPEYAQQQRDAYAGQTGLVDEYGRVIAGTEPSVAKAQLGMGLGDITNQQLSMAARGGPNGAYAQRLAAQNVARAGSDMQGQAALLRAQEIEAARRGKAAVLAQQAGEGQGMYTSTGGMGLGYGELSSGLSRTALDEAAQNRRNKYALAGTIIGGGAALGAANIQKAGGAASGGA